EGIVRIATFGFSDRELQEAVTPNHLFQVGSITKSFVALTCLQLYDEGKLDLERPILEYLPWLPIVAGHDYASSSAHPYFRIAKRFGFTHERSRGAVRPGISPRRAFSLLQSWLLH